MTSPLVVSFLTFFKTRYAFKYPVTKSLPSLDHIAVGGGLPPVWPQRHVRSSPSFNVIVPEQFVTAVGRSGKNKDKTMYIVSQSTVYNKNLSAKI